MYKFPLIAIVSVIVVLGLIGGQEATEPFHTQIELDHYMKSMMQDTSLIDGWNDLFAASGECEGCHGYDPDSIASIDAEANDINVVDDWRATMMANSAKDPFWRAKVSHESLVSPAIQNELESSCTDCHAPMGFYNAMHLGMPHYTMDDLKLDSVALDGVSCGACHQISPEGVGQTFSGNEIEFVEDIIYGPYENPFAGPMQSFVGFLPVYSEHIQRSEVCASCHTLITETVGLDGNFNGEEFVEQATYHEWVNSSYNTDDETAVECQSCHMTRIDDDVVIASELIFLPARTPFYLHDIVGGNSFMLDMMRDNIDTLDIRASVEDFDAVRASTMTLLQENTLDLDLTQVGRTADTLYLDLELTNKAGHKFPSGYPSRIAYVQLLVITEAGDTLFRTGILDDNYELVGRDFEYEQHYDVISSEEEVQVYELVMADETGAETTVLSHAEAALKDNRLAPFGFTDTHFTYDTVAYYGEVLNDDDFNKDGAGVQGTGKDLISFHIGINGEEGPLDVQARVFYQVTPPRWLESMFTFESEDIDLFRWMYESSEKEPVEVSSVAITSTLIGLEEESLELEMVAFPSPTLNGDISILSRSGYSIDGYRVYNTQGGLVSSKQVRGNVSRLQLPNEAGIYFIVVESKGVEQVLQVIRL